MRDERKLVYAEEFEESLKLTVDYLRLCDVSENYILRFVNDLRAFIHQKIAPRSEFYMEYQLKKTPEKSFRRAIFKKKYYVIYKVYDESIEFRLFISSKRDLTKIFIQD